MSKVYIVKSSCGEYEDYSCWNEKAFLNKEDAIKYANELDGLHFDKPSFITDKFEQDYIDCEYELPDWEDFPEGITKENEERYIKWNEEQDSKRTKMLIDMMHKRGYFLTKEMNDQYIKWLERKDYYDCEVEELDLE